MNMQARQLLLLLIEGFVFHNHVVSLPVSSAATWQQDSAFVDKLKAITNELGNCYIPSGIKNADIQKISESNDEVVVEVKCHPGFSIDGNSVLTCQKGVWQESFPYCIPTDCLTHYNLGRWRSGEYVIKPKSGPAKKVFCNMAMMPPEHCSSYRKYGHKSDGFYKIRQPDASIHNTYCALSTFGSEAREYCMHHYRVGKRKDGMYLLAKRNGKQLEVFCGMSTMHSTATNCQAIYNAGYTSDGFYFIRSAEGEISEIKCFMSTFTCTSSSCWGYRQKGYKEDGVYFFKQAYSQNPTEQYCKLSTFSQPLVDCLAYRNNGHSEDGLYFIKPHNLPLREVYCDMHTESGGWTLIQQRLDASTEFNQDYKTYQDGFGHAWGNVWAGLDFIHSVTQGSTELYVYLEAGEGDSVWAKYGKFKVLGPNVGYKLQISDYQGTAGDAMEMHNGHRFSTYDKDQDGGPRRNCAKTHKGGWWYANCYYAHPNGPYNYPRNGIVPTVSWVPYKGLTTSLKTTQMMIRQKP